MALPRRALSAVDSLHSQSDTPSRDRVVRWLVRGGDERIEINPATANNKYGVPAFQTREDIWFGSSTANPLSERASAAVSNALLDLEVAEERRDPRVGAELSARVRSGIEHALGLSGCSTVLAASGTDAELLALAIAKSHLPGPLTNIVIAPEETGSAVPVAALGCHFGARANSGAAVPTGRRLQGWEGDDIKVVTVPVRDAGGRPMQQSVIDDLVVAHVERALAAGRSILLHVLDRSKTGLQAPSRSVAEHLARLAPQRLLVLVDACQLRLAPSQLAADLATGFMVVVTGSKYAGGFPFAGALLLPDDLVAALSRSLSLPSGLAAYSTCADWPDSLSHRISSTLARPANAGLALRWTSALAELTPLAAVPRETARSIADEFARRVETTASALGGFEAVQVDPALSGTACPSIRSFFARRSDGTDLTFAEARSLHRALQSLPDSRRVYLGQPVEIGDRGALRVCLSAPHVVDVAARMACGETLERAFHPLSRDVDAAFASWARLAALL